MYFYNSIISKAFDVTLPAIIIPIGYIILP
jgi:hypothetical protein